MSHNPDLKYVGYLSVKIEIYNDNDDEISSAWEIFYPGNSLKKTGNFQFCDPLGKGPYNLFVKWETGGSSKSYGEFEIPYKFKK